MFTLAVLLAGCVLCWGQAVRFAYLPPTNSTAVSLADRFADFQDSEDLGIRFEEILVSSPWERQLGRIVSGGITRLALGLQGAVGKNTDNVIFSPLSVASALAVVLLGADGATYRELSQALGLAQLPEKGSAVHEQFGRLLTSLGDRNDTLILSASAVFIQDQSPIQESFLKASREIYRSDVVSLDFRGHAGEARDAINAWIENRTRGRIVNFLAEPPGPNTRVIIASALYFNGAWEFPFPKEITARRPFYAADGEVLQVDMMANTVDLPYHESAALGCRVLALPYKGGDVAMYLILPNKSGVPALRELQARLTVQAVEELVASVKEESLVVLLPRMKLEASLTLRDALTRLGVQSLFDPRRADLTRIAPGLYADDVLHKVEVEVTETGTVAAAVTLVSVNRDGSRRSFRVDRPFIFFIRQRSTGLVLFWGTVVRPTPA